MQQQNQNKDEESFNAENCMCLDNVNDESFLVF